MSADTAASVDDVVQFLLSLDKGACACIERRTSDDLTDAFLAKANQLAAAGTRAVIACADDVAARRFRTRLAAYPALSDAHVVTTEELFLRVAADERVRAVTGREPRVLDANELDVLMEDMKVSGLKPRRLREMLKFFYRGLSAYDNEQDDWLINYEEQRMFAILSENMEVRRALLPYELAAVAYRGLVEAKVELEPLAVLADDYGTLSRASQRLLDYLATDGMVVAGTTAPVSNAVEPYPCAEGFLSFAQRRGAARLMLDGGERASARTCASCDNPVDEFAYAADAVAQRVAAGVDPRDVVVAVPNGTWMAQMVGALERRGVPAVADGGPAKIKGDPRTPGRFDRLKLAAFLRLYLNPEDITSLRSWLGFGDWLLRSDAFLELMAYAREHETSVPQAIEQLRTQVDADRTSQVFGKLDAPLDELEHLLASCREGLTCAQAVSLFADHGMELSSDQEALLGNDPDHADLERLAHEALAPAARDDVAAVNVAPYRRCHGRFPRVAVLMGLVGGFLPAADAVDDKFTIDHRRAALERERLLFEDMAAMASDETLCTLFERDLLENTASLNMQTARVFIKDDVRYASVAPSVFLAESCGGAA